jgi:hypothetical protein
VVHSKASLKVSATLRRGLETQSGTPPVLLVVLPVVLLGRRMTRLAARHRLEIIRSDYELSSGHHLATAQPIWQLEGLSQRYRNE